MLNDLVPQTNYSSLNKIISFKPISQSNFICSSNTLSLSWFAE
jgi:hypothetical protein